MPRYFVSAAAGSDIRSIIRYTTIKWNGEQAARYSAELRKCFRMLAEHPGLGRACDSISPGLHGYEQGKHVIFFRVAAAGISIIRVLHERMAPTKIRLEE